MAAAPAQVRRAAIAACAAVLAAVLPGPAADPADAAVVTDPAAVVNPFIGTASGRALTVLGAGAADEAPYVQSATWDGRAWEDAYAPPPALISGGTLRFTLGTSPATGWATGPAAAPPSYG